MPDTTKHFTALSEPVCSGYNGITALTIWPTWQEWIRSGCGRLPLTTESRSSFHCRPGTPEMPDLPSHCTQIDITSTKDSPDTTVPQQKNKTSQPEVATLLKEMLLVQKKSCELLGEVLKHVSFQQRQRAAELQTWRENNPYVAQACRKAAKGLSHVHTDFLTTLAEEAAESADDFTDSEYALGEFIDRYGPRLAHFNGVMQLLSQLAMPEDENQN